MRQEKLKHVKEQRRPTNSDDPLGTVISLREWGSQGRSRVPNPGTGTSCFGIESIFRVLFYSPVCKMQKQYQRMRAVFFFPTECNKICSSFAYIVADQRTCCFYYCVHRKLAEEQVKMKLGWGGGQYFQNKKREFSLLLKEKLQQVKYFEIINNFLILKMTADRKLENLRRLSNEDT